MKSASDVNVSIELSMEDIAVLNACILAARAYFDMKKTFTKKPLNQREQFVDTWLDRINMDLTVKASKALEKDYSAIFELKNVFPEMSDVISQITATLQGANRLALDSIALDLLNKSQNNK